VETLKPAVGANVTFEEPERGAWEAYLKLSAKATAGIELKPEEHLAGHSSSYAPPQIAVR
jgi:hypothetical protein